jgi:Tol biopolymer transport system component
VSQNGVLAYQAAASDLRTQLAWVDRTGKALGELGGEAALGDVELSPNRELAAVSVLDPQRRTRDLYTVDIARGLRTRFTFEATDEQTTVWSPDGATLAYNARPKGYFDLFLKDAAGVGPERTLVSDTRNKTPLSWSPDGAVLLYSVGVSVVSNADVWQVRVDGSTPPAPFLQSPFNETDARFSPDGHWVAYVSNETGSPEVYVTRFPGPSGKWPVSSGGGNFPRWRADGRELFYTTRDGHLASVPVSLQGQEVSVGEARTLFALRAAPAGSYAYDVVADGQRFLVNNVVEAASPSPITLVVNWLAALRAK